MARVSALLLATLASYPVGLALGRPWLLPVLNAAPAWALCRVAAFATLGAVLAEPLLFRLLRRRPAGLGSPRPYLIAAAAALLADVALKAALAPAWGLWLRRVLPGSG